jgi:DNA-binding transcriptional ArsR family regulator
MLKKRQAYISQHLMVLRDAGILETRRDGKYIYYRMADHDLFDVIQATAQILNISKDNLPKLSEPENIARCDCPNCQSDN